MTELSHPRTSDIGPLEFTQPEAIYWTERYVDVLLRLAHHGAPVYDRIEQALAHLRSLTPDGPPPPFCVGWMAPR